MPHAFPAGKCGAHRRGIFMRFDYYAAAPAGNGRSGSETRQQDVACVEHEARRVWFNSTQWFRGMSHKSIITHQTKLCWAWSWVALNRTAIASYLGHLCKRPIQRQIWRPRLFVIGITYIQTYATAAGNCLDLLTNIAHLHMRVVHLELGGNKPWLTCTWSWW